MFALGRSATLVAMAAGAVGIPYMVSEPGNSHSDESALIQHVDLHGEMAAPSAALPAAAGAPGTAPAAGTSLTGNLSGDLAGNDGPDFANNGENSRLLVTADNVASGTVLDGFTITAASGTGGMKNTQAHPKILRCRFKANYAGSYSAGMNNYTSNPTIVGCVFVGNKGMDGGGMYNNASSPMARLMVVGISRMPSFP